MQRASLVGVALIVSGLSGLSGLSACQEQARQPRYAGAPPPAAPPRAATPTEAGAGEREPDVERFQLAFPTGDPETSTILVEKIVPEQVRVGERYTYTIRVTNISEQPLTDVVVRESAKGLEILEDQDQDQDRDQAPRAGARQAAGRYVIDRLAPGESQTIEVSAIGREVGIRSTCLDVDYQSTLCSPVAVVDPELRIEKVAPRTAYLCDRPTFAYAVTNTGTGTARDVVIEETLPPGLTTADGAREIRILVGELPAGETARHTVAIQPTQVGAFRSRAVARSEMDEAVSEMGQLAIVQPELAVDITGPEWQYAGEPVTYTVTVTNVSEVPARDARLKLEAPIDLAAPERSLGTLAPGQSRTSNVTVAGRGEQVQLRAAAQGSCAPVVADRMVTELRRVAALRVGTVDTADPVRVGETTTYIVTVTNQGDDAAEDVEVTAIVPEGLTVVEVDGSTEPELEGDRLRLGPLPALEPGQTARWEIEARADRPGVARFRTEVNSEFLSRPVPDVEPTRIIAPR